MNRFPDFDDEKLDRKKRDFDGRIAVEEANPPEPAPGKKVISFGLPLEEAVNAPSRPVKQVRRPRKAAAVEESMPVGRFNFNEYNRQDYGTLAESPRRRAREVAMMLLFAACGGCDWNTISNILEDAGVKGDNADFAVKLARCAYEETEASDAILSAYSRDWSVERFSAVDHSILSMAVSELRHDSGENHSIIINEAIELGKKFSSEDSGAFINGILDTIYTHEFKDRPAQAATSESAAEQTAEPIDEVIAEQEV